MEIIGGLILTIIVVSIAQSIAMLAFPRYGLKRAKKIYRKTSKYNFFTWKRNRRKE